MSPLTACFPRFLRSRKRKDGGVERQAAWITDAKANPLTVNNATDWQPGPGEIVIRTRAVAINPVDWKIQDSGKFIPTYPNILGHDVAGVVEKLGPDVTRFVVGQRVIAHGVVLATGEPKHGTFQTHTIALVKLASQIPDSLSFESAAVLPLSISTTAAGLYQEKHLALTPPTLKPEISGKIIFIYGGSSSVGASAIQLAAASGLIVATTASTKNIEYVKSLGATYVFDHSKPSLVEDVVAELTAKQFVGVFDTIALPETVAKSAEITKKLGSAKVVITLPPPQEIPEGIQLSSVWAAELYDKDEQIAEAVWGKWVPEALLGGQLKAKPDPLIFKGGLKEMQKAVDRQKQGVSAAKVVVSLP